MACKADDTCFVLFRSYVAGQGNRAAIVKLAPDVEPVTLAVLTPSLTLDNFEGLAVREQYGRTYLYIVSDNNFSDDQRTLLMKFEVRQAAPPVLGAPEPVDDFGTVDVVGDYPTLLKPCVQICGTGGNILATNHVSSVALDDWIAVVRRTVEKAGRKIDALEILEPEADFPSFDGSHPLKMVWLTLD